MTAKIDRFSGSYRFLSNFFPCKVGFWDLEFSTTEHAYQAAKTMDPAHRRIIQIAQSPGTAKRLGREVTLRPDWEDVKLDVMEDLLKQKFQYPHLKVALLNTGDAELIEGNTWGDKFWGQVDGVGENHLGRLLMKLRSNLHSAYGASSLNRDGL